MAIRYFGHEIERADYLSNIPWLDRDWEVFWDSVEPFDYDPYRKLCAAVLYDAVQVINGNQNERAKSVRAETVFWFLAKDDPSWPFTFENICNLFEIAPGVILKRLNFSAEEREHGKEKSKKENKITSRPGRHKKERIGSEAERGGSERAFG